MLFQQKLRSDNQTIINVYIQSPKPLIADIEIDEKQQHNLMFIPT